MSDTPWIDHEETGGGIPEPEPTSYPPGCGAKVDVLAERYDRGTALWHPADAGWERREQLQADDYIPETEDWDDE